METTPPFVAKRTISTHSFYFLLSIAFYIQRENKRKKED
jgi:hypothetical protein